MLGLRGRGLLEVEVETDFGVRLGGVDPARSGRGHLEAEVEAVGVVEGDIAPKRGASCAAACGFIDGESRQRCADASASVIGVDIE